MNPRQANPDHAVAYIDLCALVGRHADKVTAVEMLAIAIAALGLSQAEAGRFLTDNPDRAA